MPSTAPSSKTALNASLMVESLAGSPQELLTMLARPLFTMYASRLDQVGVLAAARGHVPDVGVRRHAVHLLDVEGLLAVPARPRRTRLGPASVYGPALYCLNWPAPNGWSPVTVANWFASALMVGDA